MNNCGLIERYCKYCNKMYMCTTEDKEICVERLYKRDLKLNELMNQ